MTPNYDNRNGDKYEYSAYGYPLTISGLQPLLSACFEANTALNRIYWPEMRLTPKDKQRLGFPEVPKANHSEYEQCGDEFIQWAQLSMEVRYLFSHSRDLDASKPQPNPFKFPRKYNIHGSTWEIMLRRGKRSISFQYTDSYNDAYTRVAHWPGVKTHPDRYTPTAYDLLACITKYNPGTFEDFCQEFGYDEDSRKAEKTYRAVVEEWLQVSAFFTPEELERLQEIA